MDSSYEQRYLDEPEDYAETKDETLVVESLVIRICKPDLKEIPLRDTMRIWGKYREE